MERMAVKSLGSDEARRERRVAIWGQCRAAQADEGVEFAASEGDDKEKWFVTEVDRAGRRELIEREDEQGCTQLGYTRSTSGAAIRLAIRLSLLIPLHAPRTMTELRPRRKKHHLLFNSMNLVSLAPPCVVGHAVSTPLDGCTEQSAVSDLCSRAISFHARPATA